MITVLACGCFDPFHYGHLLHLQTARTLGDILIVAVTMDEFINKGPNRPIFRLHERMAVLRALAIVDDVRPSRSGEESIRAIKPDVYVKGKEYEHCLPERYLVQSYGGRVVFTDETVYSSTQLVTGGYLSVPRVSER